MLVMNEGNITSKYNLVLVVSTELIGVEVTGEAGVGVSFFLHDVIETINNIIKSSDFAFIALIWGSKQR